MKKHNYRKRAFQDRRLLNAPPRQPKACKGRRNLFCVAYDACLDNAIQNNWTTFSCPGSCAFVRSYEPPDIIANNPDHWELYDFYLW